MYLFAQNTVNFVSVGTEDNMWCNIPKDCYRYPYLTHSCFEWTKLVIFLIKLLKKDALFFKHWQNSPIYDECQTEFGNCQKDKVIIMIQIKQWTVTYMWVENEPILIAVASKIVVNYLGRGWTVLLAVYKDGIIIQLNFSFYKALKQKAQVCKMMNKIERHRNTQPSGSC